MFLLRLSGHSGAGKSRLTAALPHHGLICPRAILYISRPARDGECHGQDYYFLSRAAIAALPADSFFVGPVRDMLQAVDLDQLEQDLTSSDVVLIEIFHKLWPCVQRRIKDRFREGLPTASVFMTAIDPDHLHAISDQAKRAAYIQNEVTRILEWRGKDQPSKIPKRAASAVKELAAALNPEEGKEYDLILHSAPEGPDGEDDWTKEGGPFGRAKGAIAEFIQFVQDSTST